MSTIQVSGNKTRQVLNNYVALIPNGILAKSTIKALQTNRMDKKNKVEMTKIPLLGGFVTKIYQQSLYITDGTGSMRLQLRPSVSAFTKRFIQEGSSIALVFVEFEIRSGVMTVLVEERNFFAIVCPTPVYEKKPAIYEKVLIEIMPNGTQLVKFKPLMSLKKVEENYLKRKLRGIQQDTVNANPPLSIPLPQPTTSSSVCPQPSASAALATPLQQNAAATFSEIKKPFPPKPKPTFNPPIPPKKTTQTRTTTNTTKFNRQPLSTLTNNYPSGFGTFSRQYSSAPVVSSTKKRITSYFDPIKPAPNKTQICSTATKEQPTKPGEPKDDKDNDDSSQDADSKSSSSKKATKDVEMELLRGFDTDMTYGACMGISRMQRYERALKFNLQPPPSPKIYEILLAHPNENEYDCCIYDYSMLRFLGRK